jgi:hypothetical protein
LVSKTHNSLLAFNISVDSQKFAFCVPIPKSSNQPLVGREDDRLSSQFRDQQHHKLIVILEHENIQFCIDTAAFDRWEGVFVISEMAL